VAKGELYEGWGARLGVGRAGRSRGREAQLALGVGVVLALAFGGEEAGGVELAGQVQRAETRSKV
jgi:hypothetical protein